ncbi:MAG: UDP-N-acetylmuramoyl-L-alanyl-D-glutamate--LD-lysine ligase [Patescibacteria group bacterium]|nr:MAG: UDP-N-acetylmuramoyl-L-alanyl-D-glutamate--LD-lysine ligase [Patescibacteria group bacterium]
MNKNMWQKIKNIYHLFQAIVANIYYGFPSRKIKVIGVTGTDGKTTTTTLIAHILKQSGKKVSFISTVYAEVAGKIYDVGLHVTTPSSFMVQKFLRQAVDNDDEYFVLETTSHALDQNRVWGVKFEIGVITNITHEHLDYHKTYENYVRAKEKLLKMAKIGIVNKNIKYQISNIKYSYQISNTIKKNFPNITRYNQENYSAAFLVCQLLGLSEKKIINAMQNFTLPKGRLEVFYDKEFKVIIDFAHTPNAFQKLLPEIRKKYLKKNSRLIHVFGSAGLRDRTKRPIMGKMSDKYSDYIILTEEDYRTENVDDICIQIASGIKHKPYEIITNREKAIEKAIFMAKKGDVVLLTGKSHEKSLARGKKEYPWSEHKAVEKAIKLKINNE